MKKTILLSLFACFAFVPVFGTVLNPNADMELGEVGKPAPAWQTEVLLAKRDIVIKNPSRKLVAVTTKDGHEGKGILLPPDQGATQYRLICPDFYLGKDCEVEISLDSRIGKRTDGKPVKVNIVVDFRCFGDLSIAKTEKKGWKNPNYPELNGFSVRPKTDWTTAKKRFKVRGWHNF